MAEPSDLGLLEREPAELLPRFLALQQARITQFSPLRDLRGSWNYRRARRSAVGWTWWDFLILSLRQTADLL
jgi:hypothetical protein